MSTESIPEYTMMDDLTPGLTLEERITSLEVQVANMDKTLCNILTQIEAIKELVAPTLDALSASPIGKMMGL